MFPSLNEVIGWGKGPVDSIPPNSKILLGDSNPIDSLPFLACMLSSWLKSPTSVNTAVVFVGFKTSQIRLAHLCRRAFGMELNMLAAQSRFYFIDAVTEEANPQVILQQLDSAIIKSKMTSKKCLVILEGFSSLLAVGKPLSFISDFLFECEKLCFHSPESLNTLLIHWSRDMEPDYPAHSPLIKEDLTVGGRFWSYLLTNSHFVFCFRALRSGLSRDVSGEVVVSHGALWQKWFYLSKRNAESLFKFEGTSAPFEYVPDASFVSKYPFYPILALYRVVTDSSIVLINKGHLK